jgi:hypothetical protein
MLQVHPIQPFLPSSPLSQILYEAENAVGRGVISNVKERTHIFFDNTALSIVVYVEEHRNG